MKKIRAKEIFNWTAFIGWWVQSSFYGFVTCRRFQEKLSLSQSSFQLAAGVELRWGGARWGVKQSDISLPTMNGLVVLQAYVVLHVTKSEKSTSDIHCALLLAQLLMLHWTPKNILIPTPFNNNQSSPESRPGFPTGLCEQGKEISSAF